MNNKVCAALNARTAAFNSGNMVEYKASCYSIRETIKMAKHVYKKKAEQQFNSNTWGMWEGLNETTPFRGHTNTPHTSVSLTDEMNNFYASHSEIIL